MYDHSRTGRVGPHDRSPGFFLRPDLSPPRGDLHDHADRPSRRSPRRSTDDGSPPLATPHHHGPDPPGVHLVRHPEGPHRRAKSPRRRDLRRPGRRPLRRQETARHPPLRLPRRDRHPRPDRGELEGPHAPVSRARHPPDPPGGHRVLRRSDDDPPHRAGRRRRGARSPLRGAQGRRSPAPGLALPRGRLPRHPPGPLRRRAGTSPTSSHPIT